MYCLTCGIKAREAARFCRHCGAPVEERHEPEASPRVTVVLPRPPAPQELEETPPEAEMAWSQNVQAVILPISEGALGLPETAEILSGPTSRQPRKSRHTNPEEASNHSAHLAQPLQTEMLQRESEAKPFFTQVLTSGLSRQHRRLASIVPLLLLIVILLFIFAYIAAK